MEERAGKNFIYFRHTRYLFDEISLSDCQKKEIKIHTICFNKSKNTTGLASEKNTGMRT
jgi:hypothetical protein